MSSLPYWLVLLRHYERRGYIHNGLTIPFLIGARIRLEPIKPVIDISELVSSINDVGGTIMKCPNIGEFVIGSLELETPIQKSKYTKCFGNIIVTDDSLKSVGIGNIQELICYFEQLYQETIDNGMYSKEDGKWMYFTEIDARRIDEIELH